MTSQTHKLEGQKYIWLKSVLQPLKCLSLPIIMKVAHFLVSEAQNYQVLSKRQIIESNLEISPPLGLWYLGESQTNIKFCGTSDFHFTEKVNIFGQKWPKVNFIVVVLSSTGCLACEANLVCSQNSNQEFIVQVMSLSSQNSPLPNLHHPTLVLVYLTKDQPLYLLILSEYC